MLFAVFDGDTVLQLTMNGIFAGSAYGLLGVGFAMILGVTGRFHFAYAFTYTLAAYMAFTFLFRWDGFLHWHNFWFASLLGILVATAVGVGIERFIYRPIASRAGATSLLAVFVASLGIGIAGANMISLFWSQRTQAFFGPLKKRWVLGPASYENFKVYQVLSSLALVLILAAVLRYTALGRMIKATRVNPELATVIGINANTVYLIAFAIGSFLGGVAAIWYGLLFTVEPNMGQRPVIFAFVVAFLAGTASSPIRVFFTGILVALIEQYASIWLSVRWTQTTVFVILALYLSWQSLKTTRFFQSMRILRRAGT